MKLILHKSVQYLKTCNDSKTVEQIYGFQICCPFSPIKSESKDMKRKTFHAFLSWEWKRRKNTQLCSVSVSSKRLLSSVGIRPKVLLGGGGGGGRQELDW